MASPSRDLVLGRTRVPRVVVALIVATALLSIGAAVDARNGALGIGAASVLSSADVARGQVWRLFTWALVELDALPLIFACLTLIWCGGDLARSWGERRLLGFYFAAAAIAGLLTCGVAWAIGASVMSAGSWPVLCGLMLAWGLIHPGREIRFWGVLRMTGRHVAIAVVAGTVLFSLFRGITPHVPHFAAELCAFVYLGPPRRLPALIRRRRHQSLVERAQTFDLHEWIERDRKRR
jgi:membrane associated rhomboid family serine protease